MKKILAILLAMLMLLGTAALAEDAAVLTVDNVSVQADGQTIAIQDLTASLVLENVNNLPSIALLIDGGSEPLVTAVGQLSSTKLTFAVDGMGYGYSVDIPAQVAEQLAQVGDAGMAMLVSLLVPAFDQIALPPFSGMDVPKADMTSVLSQFMTGASTFEIPADQVNELLNQAIQLAKSQGNVANLDEAIQALEQLKASGIGIAIQGDIADDGVTQTTSGGVFLAMNGTVSGQELARLTVTSSLNNFQAALSVSDSGMSSDVLTASLVSDPAAASLDFELNVANEANVTFGLYQEDGLQKASLKIDAGADESANLVFAYGSQNGSDVVSFSVNASGASLDAQVNTAMGADSVRTGTATLSASQYGEEYSFTGDVTMYVGDAIDLSGFAMPSDLRSFDQMDTDAIAQAFQPVVDYINSHATMG